MLTFKHRQPSLLAASIALALSAPALAAEPEENPSPVRYDETLQIIGHQDRLRTEAGSATLLDEMQLEKFKYDDIERILAQVPGVNIRSEDGFGLRPNIGFRGVTPERSKKITLMEDGVLIAPAPYSASAAYYFPLMAKITSVEVFKGPAAIQYGPYTVAGALNMTTRAVPEFREGQIDLAGGSDGYLKAHGYYGDTIGDIGFLLDAVHVQSDGFKELDGGGDTGFDKNEVMAKLRYNLDTERFSQVFELKMVYANEDSNETYLGLTDADFAENPNRRYAASADDKMTWDHTQFQFNHFIAGDNFDLTTRVYRNDFERAWRKLNGFASQNNPATDRDLSTILQNPDDGINAIYYDVLTGAKDSEQAFETLVLGTNDREYYAQGIQTDLRYAFELFSLNHNLHAGVRYHEDEIHRNHTEDHVLMQSGQLVETGDPTVTATLNTEKTEAWSLYLQDTLVWDKLEVTLGVRGEFLDQFYQNDKPGSEGDYLRKETNIWLPGASVFYRLSDDWGVFAGVHEGFVPTSPQQNPAIESETSVNYELGTRFSNGNTQLETVAFFNDFDNLKESCTFSASASCSETIDQEYNGGEVNVYGLEFSASHTLRGGGFDWPLTLVYTYTDSEFQSDFESDFTMWGDISKGDKLPYLPEHQATLGLGIAGNQWEANLLVRYQSEMLEASGEGVTLSGVKTEAFTTLDLAASYDLGDWGEVYGKVDNLLDEEEIVSRRPYGARPNKPQQFVVGYRLGF
ncbi:TonB-dependent receptor family protein [Ferrimonas balearica]|uniref:TonB-dependent receptor family protein n=1 Tax=Ferrimonas balearica TaxID=44012 RepID=UPI001C99DB8A|nr:TonB-dependent receptor [Ferrimonas balearica]MBY5921117.1 TonB-dependent receptor [Ferrimonas balearica]MBY5996198.1 TonB-dependent receptor [Ferrimonas balearica]